MEEQIARLWHQATAVSGERLVLRPLVVQFERMVYRVVAAAEVLEREMSLGEEGYQKEGNGKIHMDLCALGCASRSSFKSVNTSSWYAKLRRVWPVPQHFAIMHE